MGARGPKAAGLAAVPATLRKRLPPPAELKPREARIWEAITACRPADWFDDGSAPLLAAYCRSIEAQNAIAAARAEVAELTTPEGAKNFVALSVRLDAEVQLTIKLATAMRLSQQARRTAGAAKTAAVKGSSVAELWDASA